MATDSIVVSALIPAPPQRVYEAWLSSKEHTAFTGSRADITPTAGAAFSAGDGYISGTNRELVENERIVQSWRTTEFPKDSPDSLVAISFERDEDSGGTEVTLIHDDIPEGQGEQYARGWVDYYFERLKKYFSRLTKTPARKTAAKKPAAKKPAAKKPAAKKPAAKKPAAKKTAAKKTAAKKTAAKKPAAKKPAAKKPAAKKPAAK